MREIKFKAFHKEEKRVFEVFMIDFYFEKVYELIQFENGACGNKCYKFSEVELMEFTGLKDCTGKEIYEGDILSLRLDDYAGINEFTIFSLVEDDKNNIHHLLSYVSNHEKRDIHVLGNVYQNPELLEVA